MPTWAWIEVVPVDPALRARAEALLAEMYGPDPGRQISSLIESASPEFHALVLEVLVDRVWARQGLDRKTRMLCVISAFVAMRLTVPLRLQIMGALRNGMTREELWELLILLAMECGFPAVVEAIPAVQQALADFEAGRGLFSEV